ncbi:flagellar filament capping protein FliD [Cellulomonas rhizosphaerae]|uniref:Flagellar hook-associated protein 2 n=1 Tax=Cellulomonas rhizosphaerae TaxID=2293719 RepID=A0A413RQ08_9CELL|nr:flagellar filament capping protein FliD [Cellulomonas rhizosphaerae]RHA44014.1 flagellar cap protein [Cellulomonas rhizosphaerae]
MATLGIDGLVSGLDTTSLINQLMQAESGPQTLLKAKQTATTSLVTALQALNTKVSSLGDAATKAATASSWQVTKATSSATSVTATTSAGASAAALSFTVDKVATSQVSLASYDDLVAGLGGATTLTLRRPDGTTTEVAVGSSAADLAKNITGSGAGVSAAVVTANGTTRLQLTGKTPGEANAFELFAGKAEDVVDGQPALAATPLRAASDAAITLWAGTAGAQQVTSSTNTFADVLTGVSISVSTVEAAPVTLDVARDTAAVTSLASGLVGSLGVVLSEITSRTTATTTTDTDGRTVVSGGLFSGESSTRDLQQRLQQAASYPVDGISPSTVGIVVGRDGTFTFDQTTFEAALAADPAKVQKVVSGLAQRVADVATRTSDKVDGSLTLQIAGQQTLVSDMGDQIAGWDVRLALRRESLQRTYSALEVTLSGLQSQSSWLSSQLASLSTSSS